LLHVLLVSIHWCHPFHAPPILVCSASCTMAHHGCSCSLQAHIDVIYRHNMLLALTWSAADTCKLGQEKGRRRGSCSGVRDGGKGGDGEAPREPSMAGRGARLGMAPVRPRPPALCAEELVMGTAPTRPQPPALYTRELILGTAPERPRLPAEEPVP
jgi:hypothetical protein